MDELGRISPEEYRSRVKTPTIIILDNVRSLMNVGSVFRTSDAFGVEKIFLCGITGCPPNKEIHKTALGATDSVAWEYVENTIDALSKIKSAGYTVMALEQVTQSTFLDQFIPVKNEKYALIFGNEVKGVQDDVLPLCDGCLEIPQFGTKHSFNIAVTAGITLWHFHMRNIEARLHQEK